MSTPKRASASCPFCSWSTSRSYNLPYHIAMYHYSELNVTSMSGHYLSCYGKKRNSNMEFVVCLTCHGGSMIDTSTKKRSEWVTKHAKNDKCRENHRQTFTDMKILMKDTLGQGEPVVSSINTPQINNCDYLWNSLKQKPKLQSYIAEIEQSCRIYHEDDDEPYSFKAEDGMEQMIITTMGYKKHITQLENKIKTMETEHERQLIEMRDRIAELERNVRDLQVAVRQEAYKAQNAQARCDQMERELNRYKERYPPPPDEDPV